jgi:transcription antitermination factor NusG
VVGTGDRPVSVEGEIISDIKARIGEDGCVCLEEREWQPRDAVTVDDGPLKGWSGVFERTLPDRQRVVILLNAVQSMRVILERHSLVAA